MPLHPAAFFGATILCHGFINAFPLARLPAFPLIIHTPLRAPITPRPMRCVTPLLTWHADDTPPPPPPSPATSPEHTPPAETKPAPRMRKIPPRRDPSSRLKAKEPAGFITMAAKATQLKTLKNTLSSCSRDLQDHVNKHGLLRKKKPIRDQDLRKLAAAAGIGSATVSKLDKVLKVAE